MYLEVTSYQNGCGYQAAFGKKSVALRTTLCVDFYQKEELSAEETGRKTSEKGEESGWVWG